jgi:hypothetical protein
MVATSYSRSCATAMIEEKMVGGPLKIWWLDLD